MAVFVSRNESSDRLLGRYEEALADLTRSLELRPDDPDTLNNRGMALGNLERHEEALADYNRSLEMRPNFPDTLNNRATVLLRLCRHEEALADYNRALELQPGHPAIPYNLARLQCLMEHLDEALRWLERAIDGNANLRERAAMDEAFVPLGDDPQFGPRFLALIAEESDDSPPESP